MRTLALLLLVAAAALPARGAEAPDATTIVARMRAAMEPRQASTRRFTLTVTGDGETSRFTAAQARKVVRGQARMLTVVLAPADQRGVASLIMQGAGDGADVRALWVPAVRRTRMLTPVGGYEAFLNSDFTYADLGFVDPGATYRLVGTTTRDGTTAYELHAVPRETWYYSKIAALVDAGTLLPLRRDYYDPAGTLWKTETFDDVTIIDGTAVATHVTMQDRQAKQSSTLIVDALRFGVELPDALFEPGTLRHAVDSPLWADAP